LGRGKARSSLLPKDVFCNPGREEKSGRFTETEKHAAPWFAALSAAYNTKKGRRFLSGPEALAKFSSFLAGYDLPESARI
jgi:hypothetical protein